MFTREALSYMALVVTGSYLGYLLLKDFGVFTGPVWPGLTMYLIGIWVGRFGS